jgi:Aerotolerance regulator N-terminal/von Willebrand factor type A domain
MLLQPLMLAWVGGAAIPLVLHLLSRSRYRAVNWGAMMFLTGIDAGPQYSARLKQWVLLLLRMGVVGLLAVALARPVIASKYAWVPTAGLTTGGPAAAVIILDDSASMGYQQSGKSRLDLARQVTLQILSSLKHGDEAALLLAGDHEYQPPLPPSADLQSIAGRVIDLQPDTGQSDFSTDVVKAADLLEHVVSADREIYLICDRQASSWRNLNDAFKQQWSARRRAGSLPRLTVIPIGGDESDNVAVESIEFPDHAAIRDQTTIAQVRIRNYGPTALPSVPLSVWSANRTFFKTDLALAARSIRTVTVPIRFVEAGSRVLSAAVESTGLTTDDRLDYSVDVLDIPRALVVTSNKPASSQPTTAPLLFQPIANRKAVDFTTTLSARELNADVLKGCTEIILDDVAYFSTDQLKVIKTFVSEGGSVLVLPGREVTAEQYNRTLCGVNGIIHATIGSPILKPVHLAGFDHQHPIFRFLPDRADPPTNIPSMRFFPAGAHPSDVHVLARYNSGEPFLLESTGDRGRVILMTAAIDRRALAANGAIQPLMQSILRHLGTAAAADRNIWPGQAIVAYTNQPVEDRSANVQFVSDGTREPAFITHLNDHTEIRFNKTARPGIYRLRYRSAGKEVLLNYVAATGHADSDLTPMTDDQWKAISKRISFDRVDLSQTTIAQALDIERGGREIWIELLGGMLLLMTIEMLLSRWWSIR